MENTQVAPVAGAPIGELTPQQALTALIQAVNFAQSKGIYSLEDAEILSKAVKVFVKKEEPVAASTAEAEPESPTNPGN